MVYACLRCMLDSFVQYAEEHSLALLPSRPLMVLARSEKAIGPLKAVQSRMRAESC